MSKGDWRFEVTVDKRDGEIWWTLEAEYTTPKDEDAAHWQWIQLEKWQTKPTVEELKDAVAEWRDWLTEADKLTEELNK